MGLDKIMESLYLYYIYNTMNTIHTLVCIVFIIICLRTKDCIDVSLVLQPQAAES